MRLLVVEDDRKQLAFLLRAFADEGHAVDGCCTGTDAVRKVETTAYDLIVLDWMLPELDGLGVCRQLRDRGHGVPILVLTARSEMPARVAALDSGADDYLTKPFYLEELHARVRSLSRRRPGPGGHLLRAGPFEIDEMQHRALMDGALLLLAPRELALFALLVRNLGRVVSRSDILLQVWDAHVDPESNTIDVHVRNLRSKLGKMGTCIETVRGEGYRFVLVY